MNLALPEVELAPEERDRILDQVADAVSRYRMEFLAVLVLELHRPWMYSGSQIVAVLGPALAPAFGWAAMQKLYHLLETRENLDLLLERIEARAAEKGLMGDTPANPSNPGGPPTLSTSHGIIHDRRTRQPHA